MANINDRCPLQSECGRKKCMFKSCERDCSYYKGNSRPGAEILDQEETMEAELATKLEAELEAEAAPQPDPATVEAGDTEGGAEPVSQGAGIHMMTSLPVDKLYPHPDNPRKELGDLTELADSIIYWKWGVMR